MCDAPFISARPLADIEQLPAGLASRGPSRRIAAGDLQYHDRGDAGRISPQQWRRSRLSGIPFRTRWPTPPPRSRRQEGRPERLPSPRPSTGPPSGAKSSIWNACTPRPIAPPVAPEGLMQCLAASWVSQREGQRSVERAPVLQFRARRRMYRDSCKSCQARKYWGDHSHLSLQRGKWRQFARG
jgi:hypothetical protein